jgi:5-methylcytosine-specific restriction endonuclease McrA
LKTGDIMNTFITLSCAWKFALHDSVLDVGTRRAGYGVAIPSYSQRPSRINNKATSCHVWPRQVLQSSRTMRSAPSTDRTGWSCFGSAYLITSGTLET